MFGKKKTTIPQIDKDQLERIEYAQKRIRQKKRLYTHVVFFLIGTIFLILTQSVLGIGKSVNILNVHWSIFVILAWLFLIVYHFITVFITNKFMGKTWEKKQLDKLVNLQEQQIEKLKLKAIKMTDNLAQNKSKGYKEKSKITIIVAAGEDNAIGKDNDLIWHLSNDLKRFKALTSGHCIIMGRKTFESFPKPLPNRTHIVITRQKNYKAPEGVIIVNNLSDALDAAKHDIQPFIIGGGEIYKLAMSIADKLELTRVHAKFEDADTFFPKIDTSKWDEIERKTYPADEKHNYKYSFITYHKIKS